MKFFTLETTNEVFLCYTQQKRAEEEQEENKELKKAGEV